MTVRIAQAVPADTPAAFSYAPLSRIFVRNYETRADIGALEFERHGPQRIRVSVTLTVDTNTLHSDRLENIVPYHPIVEKIDALVATGHINLVETFAQRLAEAIMADARVHEAEITIEKLEIIDGAESAGITLVARR
jgi:dihydroneopterin aldolase